MFWAWRGAPGVDDSGITTSSFADAGGLPCELLAGFGISFVFPLCIGVLFSLLGCMPGGCSWRRGLQLFSCWTQIGS